jgi:hypothetical protein
MLPSLPRSTTNHEDHESTKIHEETQRKTLLIFATFFVVLVVLVNFVPLPWHVIIEHASICSQDTSAACIIARVYPTLNAKPA